MTCTVTFDGYGTTEIVRLADLRPQGWEEEDNAGEAKRRREALAGKNSRQKREQMREYKKKKAQKKAARQQEIEELRESEKTRWKQFTSKVWVVRNTTLPFHSFTYILSLHTPTMYAHAHSHMHTHTVISITWKPSKQQTKEKHICSS